MNIENTETGRRRRVRTVVTTASAALLLALGGTAAISASGTSDLSEPASSTPATQTILIAQATTSAGADINGLIELAGIGDKDAALQLARHFATGADPDHETAAKYAMIALVDGGQKYAVPLVSNTRAWPREFWRMMQLEMLTNGDYTSTIDGLPGRGTQRAVWATAGAQPPAATQRIKKRYRKKTPRGSHSN